jgi:hypothetical protein
MLSWGLRKLGKVVEAKATKALADLGGYQATDDRRHEVPVAPPHVHEAPAAVTARLETFAHDRGILIASEEAPVE